MQTENDWRYFLELQANTGWGRVLGRFAAWIAPQPGWLALDIGCGPGLLPVLLSRHGCRAWGCDLSIAMFRPKALHSPVLVADVFNPPFPTSSFDLVTASNLLFLLADPLKAIIAIQGLLHNQGQACFLNPSEQLSVATATRLANERGLAGLARQTLLNWAARAEATFRWTEVEFAQLLAAAGLELLESQTYMGPGFARFTRAVKKEE